MKTTLTDYQLDALREMVNIGVGRAAATLNEILEKHVQLSIPNIYVRMPHELEAELAPIDEILAAVRLGFRGEFSGVASLVFPPDTAANLVSILTNDDIPPTEDMDALRQGTLTEVGNIVLNGVMGSLSNMMELHLQYSLPTYAERPILALMRDPANVPILIAQAVFHVASLDIEGTIYLVFEAGSFDFLVHHIDRQSE